MNRGCFDVGDDDVDATSPSWKNADQTEMDSEQQCLTELSPGDVHQESEANNFDDSRRGNTLSRQVVEHKIFLSGPITPENAYSPNKKIIGDGNR